MTDEFWTEKEVRQGCSLSLTLFNIYVTDLEDEMRKEQFREISVGREKFLTISFVNDIVLLVKNEEGLKGMLKKFRKYIERKGLILSLKKSKVMVFENDKREGKEREGEMEMERGRNRRSQGNQI